MHIVIMFIVPFIHGCDNSRLFLTQSAISADVEITNDLTAGPFQIQFVISKCLHLYIYMTRWK